jgi:hypothetical protein
MQILRVASDSFQIERGHCQPLHFRQGFQGGRASNKLDACNARPNTALSNKSFVAIVSSVKPLVHLVFSYRPVIGRPSDDLSVTTCPRSKCSASTYRLVCGQASSRFAPHNE